MIITIILWHSFNTLARRRRFAPITRLLYYYPSFKVQIDSIQIVFIQNLTVLRKHYPPNKLFSQNRYKYSMEKIIFRDGLLLPGLYSNIFRIIQCRVACNYSVLQGRYQICRSKIDVSREQFRDVREYNDINIFWDGRISPLTNTFLFH